MNRRRARPRKWRLRGRKGQVAAVATILGLLLVVTFIANYLTTSLPTQMSQNDLNHVLLVENQFARFQALLQAATTADAVGAQVTQPITLGSDGAPPFAGPDSGSIGPAANGSGYTLGYSLSAPVSNTPPTGGTAGTGYVPSACTKGSNSIACSGTGPYHVYWNFSAASSPSSGYSITTTTGSYLINFTGVSGGTITVTTGGASPLNLLVMGNGETINLQSSAGPNVDNIEIVGNNDTLSIPTVGFAATLNLYLVGVHDVVSFGSILTPATVTVAASFFGFDDYLSAGNGTTSSGNVVSVYFTGYNPTTAAMTCPVGNLASSTDKVAYGTTGTGTYTVTFNTTSGGGTAAKPWTVVKSTASLYCPYYVSPEIPYTAVTSAGITAKLYNTYAPLSAVAFDAGAIVFAQSGGVPILVEPPGISVTNSSGVITSVSLWFPMFLGSFGSDAGTSTTDLSARLISVTTISLGSASTFTVENNSYIDISITSEFAAGWVSYFNSSATFSNWWSCAGPAIACYGPYAYGNPVATVTLAIPTGTQLSTFLIEVPVFSLSLV